MVCKTRNRETTNEHKTIKTFCDNTTNATNWAEWRCYQINQYSNHLKKNTLYVFFPKSLEMKKKLNNINLKMVFAPFIAGGAYALIGSKQAKNKEAEYRLSFEDVCSNLRVEDED